MALFFVSSLILPYVPTILASTLVLFLGLELMIESLWESAKTLIWSEWGIVVGTLLACTFLGFAPGFGVGIALAILVYVMLAAKDTVSTRRQNPIWSVITQLTVVQGVRVVKLPSSERLHKYRASSIEHASNKTPSISEHRGNYPLSERLSISVLKLSSETAVDRVALVTPQKPRVEAERPAITVLRLSGYVCAYQCSQN